MADIIIDSDSGKFKAGDDLDLEIYNNGSHSYIANATATQSIVLRTRASGGSTADAVTIGADKNVTMVGNLIIDANDKGLILGADQDATIYSGDSGEITFVMGSGTGVGTNEGYIGMNIGDGTYTTLDVRGGEDGSAYLRLTADQGDDNADHYRMAVAAGGGLTVDSYSTGSWVTHLALAASSAYVHMAGGSDVRLTLGSQGTAGTNDANWIRGSSSTLSFNSASSGYAWEIAGGTKMTMNSSGQLVIPSQPAFMVHPSGTQSDIANDSNVEIAFGTERFDQGSNFASNTFTAPATGKYQLNVSLEFTNMDSAATYYQVNLATSNDIYYFYIDPDFGQDTAGSFTVGGSVLADMDTNDTAVVQVRTSDGTAQMDVATQSFFSGFLAC